jgi:hypothetical protein
MKAGSNCLWLSLFYENVTILRPRQRRGPRELTQGCMECLRRVFFNVDAQRLEKLEVLIIDLEFGVATESRHH